MFARGEISSPGRVAAAVLQTDYTRRPLIKPAQGSAHKEWQHFVVLTDSVDLLVNFSVSDDVRPQAPPGAELPRLVLVVNDGEWDGDVETFAAAETRVVGGRIDFTFAHNRLVFEDGSFHISVRLRERPVSLDLRLTPVTEPAYIPSIPMLEGPPLHWTVVPRLLVTGTITVNGRRHELDRAPAYHDHNWGHFYWGHNISWDWSFVLPADPTNPWSLTFLRLTDRIRSVALAQDILVWRGERMVEVFREREVELQPANSHLEAQQVFKVPRTMALLAPELTADIPAGFTARGRNWRDWIECSCTPYAISQVLIPSETDLGVTIFNEVNARSTVRGCIAGEDFSFSGRSIMEFIRYV